MSEESSAPRPTAERMSRESKTTEIAHRLVPAETVNREAKVLAIASGKAGAMDVAPEASRSIVVLMLRQFDKEILYDLRMAHAYRTFTLFVSYAAFLLITISLQRHVGNVSVNEQFQAIEDRYFGFGNDIIRDESEIVGDRIEDWTGVQNHIRDVVIDAMFDEQSCGNDFCDVPDEYPAWFPGGREFPGCSTDCGNVDTTTVTVHFFDAWKYEHAVNMIQALATETDVRGYTPRQWGVLDEDGALAFVPIAGWNICHKTDREQGYNRQVCVFDGDVFVDTLPFRTEELDVSSTAFGGSFSAELYAGDWELRMAFQNFNWTHPETGESVQMAYPAIRGKICITNATTGDEACETWDPCPDLCPCEFIDNDYYCFDDDYWSAFNVSTMTTPFLPDDPELAAYPEAASIEATAAWWRIQRSPLEDGALPLFWTDRDPPDFLAGAENEWSRTCWTYELLLLAADQELAWDERDTIEVWTAVDVNASSTQEELADARLVKAYSLGFADSSGKSCVENTILLCDDKQYVFGVSQYNVTTERATAGENMAYSLTRDGEVVFRGNAAWVYSPINATDERCASQTYERTFCFDQERSYCFWNASLPAGTYCDPTLQYTDQQFRQNDFAYDDTITVGDASGSYCDAPATCSDHDESYNGLTTAYACYPPDVDDADLPPNETSSYSPSLDPEDSRTRPLVTDARHVACTFSNGLCGWEASSDGAWRQNEGPTATSWTGPSVDGDKLVFRAYAYAEASLVASNSSTFELFSPNFTLANDSLVTFDYHMYGHRVQELRLEELIVEDVLNFTMNGSEIITEVIGTETIRNTIWAAFYNQMPQWHQDGVAVVSREASGLVFSAVDVIDSVGDIAIDDIAIRVMNGTFQEDPSGSGDDVCVLFYMINEDGPGWSGSSYRITGPDRFLEEGTLETDSFDVDELCFPPGCYSLTVTEGDTDESKHWEMVVTTSGGGEYSALSGNTGVTTSFVVNEVDVDASESCTQAPTATPAPSLFCGADIAIELFDSFGDGFNGATFAIDAGGVVVAEGTLTDGFFSSTSLCLEERDACYNITVTDDNQPSEVSWAIVRAATTYNGVEIPRDVWLNGSANFRGNFYVADDGVAGGGGVNCTQAAEAAVLNAGYLESLGDSTNQTELTRCFSNWRVARETVDDGDVYYELFPGEMETCTQVRDKCLMVVYSWPPTELIEYFENAAAFYPINEGEPESFVGLGGCASRFTDMAASPWSSCINQDWINFAPPSHCVSCEGDLCNRPDTTESSASWYSNVFGVTSVALYHSMDWVLESAEDEEFDTTAVIDFVSSTNDVDCDSSVHSDGNCNLEYFNLGCDYDGGDCCDDLRTSCSAPWYPTTKSPWRYAFTTTEGGSHATVPYTLRDAVKDKMLLHSRGDPNDYTLESWVEAEPVDDENIVLLLPSLTCPECSASDIRRINFTVAPFTLADTQNPNDNEMFALAGENDMRIRYFPRPNIVLYGVMLTQTRAKLFDACPTYRLSREVDRDDMIDILRYNLRQGSDAGCLTVASRLEASNPDNDDSFLRSDSSQFGIDPAFDSTNANLYKPGSEISDFYDDDEVREDTGVPYGFQLRMGAPRVEHRTRLVPAIWKLFTRRYPRDYPVFIDVNANNSRASTIFDTVVDGGYFSGATHTIEVTIMSFNPETELFGLITSTYTNSPAGGINADHGFGVVDVDYYSSQRDIGRAGIECITLLLLLLLLYAEFTEMIRAVRIERSVLPYIFDFSNFIDLFGYSFQFSLAFLWGRAIWLCYRFTPEAKLFTHDELAEARILEAQEGTHQAQRRIDELGNIKEALDDYEVFATIAIIALAIQCLKALRFHPTFGLVSATIVNMSAKVFFWMILLGLVVGCYAVLGTLLFGQENGDFADLPSSFITLLAALSGLYDYTTLTPSPGITDQLFFWTYMFIAFFVLLNVLLAIIVEGYDSSKSILLERDPLRFFVAARFNATPAGRCLLPATTVHKIITDTLALLGTKEKDDAPAPAPEEAPRGRGLVRKISSKLLTTRAGPRNFDELIASFDKLRGVRQAREHLDTWTEEDERSYDELAYAWKPAIDEQDIAVDANILQLALGTTTPGASHDLLTIWRLVALNIMARYGHVHDLQGTEDIDAFSRLVDVHRLVDLHTITNDPSADIPRCFVACYNYAQGREDSLLAYASDTVQKSEDTDTTAFNDVLAKLAMLRETNPAFIHDLKDRLDSAVDSTFQSAWKEGMPESRGD